MKIMPCLAVVVSLLVLPVGDAGTRETLPPDKVVVQNYYYAKPGRADEVYRWRLHASDVRVNLGFARGRVLRGIDSIDQEGDAKERPDVIWECDYASMADRERESKALGTSDEFKKVQE